MEMTQEWITNYNKKCAEFLEWEYFQPYWYPKEDSHGIYKTPWNIEIMKFHSDWNWIMEVCIKLGMEFVTTNKKQLILEVYDKLRSMETNT